MPRVEQYLNFGPTVGLGIFLRMATPGEIQSNPLAARHPECAEWAWYTILDGPEKGKLAFGKAKLMNDPIVVKHTSPGGVKLVPDIACAQCGAKQNASLFWTLQDRYKFQKCGGCKQVWYCGHSCQKKTLACT